MKRFISLFLATVLLLPLLSACGAGERSSPFAYSQYAWSVEYNDKSDSFQLYRNGSPFGKPIDGRPLHYADSISKKDAFSMSTDGSVACIISEDLCLYLLAGSKPELLQESVVSALISRDGSGLAYMTEDGELYLHDLENNRKSQAAKMDPWSRYVISPNGDYLFYRGMEVACVYDGSGSRDVGSDAIPIAVDDNGTAICEILCEDQDMRKSLMAFPWDDAPVTLVKGDQGILSVVLNRDHTQVLFSDAEGVSLWDGSGIIRVISLSLGNGRSVSFEPVVPHGVRGDYYRNSWFTSMITVGTCIIESGLQDLRSAFYIVEKQAFYLDSQWKPMKISGVGEVSFGYMTPNGSDAYFQNTEGSIYRCRSVTPDCPEEIFWELDRTDGQGHHRLVGVCNSGVYFVRDEERLIFVDSSGKAEALLDHVVEVMPAADGTLYCTGFNSSGAMDLYCSQNGKKAKLLEKDIQGICVNGQVAMVCTQVDMFTGSYEADLYIGANRKQTLRGCVPVWSISVGDVMGHLLLLRMYD